MQKCLERFAVSLAIRCLFDSTISFADLGPLLSTDNNRAISRQRLCLEKSEYIGGFQGRFSEMSEFDPTENLRCVSSLLVDGALNQAFARLGWQNSSNTTETYKDRIIHDEQEINNNNPDKKQKYMDFESLFQGITLDFSELIHKKKTDLWLTGIRGFDKRSFDGGEVFVLTIKLCSPPSPAEGECDWEYLLDVITETFFNNSTLRIRDLRVEFNMALPIRERIHADQLMKKLTFWISHYTSYLQSLRITGMLLLSSDFPPMLFADGIWQIIRSCTKLDTLFLCIHIDSNIYEPSIVEELIQFILNVVTTRGWKSLGVVVKKVCDKSITDSPAWKYAFTKLHEDICMGLVNCSKKTPIEQRMRLNSFELGLPLFSPRIRAPAHLFYFIDMQKELRELRLSWSSASDGSENALKEFFLAFSSSVIPAKLQTIHLAIPLMRLAESANGLLHACKTCLVANALRRIRIQSVNALGPADWRSLSQEFQELRKFGELRQSHAISITFECVTDKDSSDLATEVSELGRRIIPSINIDFEFS